MLPPIFLSIPLLRDVVMWSGGVTYKATPWRTMWRENLSAEEKERRYRSRRNCSILELLNANRSVCYAPSGFSNVLNEFNDEDPEAGVKTNIPDDELFDFARQNRVQIIPVVVENEKKRYHVLAGNGCMRWIHTKTYPLFGYPIPLLFWGRFFSSKRPPQLEIQIGPVIHCEQYASTEKLKAAFTETVTTIQDTPGEGNEFHIM